MKKQQNLASPRGLNIYERGTVAAGTLVIVALSGEQDLPARGKGIIFVLRWSVHKQLMLGTLKMARVGGLTFSRMFSLGYPAGPEPNGTSAAFRSFLLTHSRDLAPRVKGGPITNSMQTVRRIASHCRP